MANKPFANINFDKITKATKVIPWLGAISQAVSATNKAVQKTKPIAKTIQKMTPEKQQETAQKFDASAAQEKYTNLVKQQPFSEKEVAFLGKVKSLGRSKAQALDYLSKKRAEPQDINPAVEWSVGKDIGEGLVNYAGSLPKYVAESGLLNKPVAAITRGVRNVADKLGANVKSKEELNKSLQVNPFSEFAWGSQVGGNPESKVAKWVEKTMNTAELAVWAATLLKWISRAAGKQISKSKAKSITKAIENGTLTEKKLWSKGKQILSKLANEWVKEQRVALKWGRLVDNSRSKIGEFLFGTKKAKIEPSKRDIEAVWSIIKEIPNASKKPIPLYNQMTDKIEDIGKSLGSKLKQIDVSNLDDAKLTTVQKIEDFISEPSVQELYGNANIKKVKSLMWKILDAADADEIWKARKEFDMITPESIKNITNLSSDKAQLANSFWRETRGFANDLLDEIAKNASDIAVKDQLRTMSNLYHGQNQIIKNLGRLAKSKQGIINLENIIKTAAIGAGANVYNKITQ